MPTGNSIPSTGLCTCPGGTVPTFRAYHEPECPAATSYDHHLWARAVLNDPVRASIEASGMSSEDVAELRHEFGQSMQGWDAGRQALTDQEKLERCRGLYQLLAQEADELRHEHVYVVYDVIGEENRAVFSTREAAETYVVTLPEIGPGDGSGCEIEEFALDQPDGNVD